MKERITKVVDKSRVVWESLEAWVRERIQGYVQDLLEEEVTALLGREKSERCQEIDAMGGYRNGHGKPRKLSLSCGTVELRRPRVRGLEARFESRILPLFVRRSEEVGALLPELYLHGLAMGDFEFAWRKDLDGRDLAGATIRRKLAALSSLFEHLCEANAVTHNPVKGVKRPKVESYEGKTPALGDGQAQALLDAPGGGAKPARLRA